MPDKRMWKVFSVLLAVSTLAICGSQMPSAKVEGQGAAAAVTCTFITVCPTQTPVSEAAAAMSDHVVQSGETLSGIARRYGLSLKELLAMNRDIADPHRIRPGQRVRVKADAAQAAAGAQSAGPEASGPAYVAIVFVLLVAFLMLLGFGALIGRRR